MIIHRHYGTDSVPETAEDKRYGIKFSLKYYFDKSGDSYETVFEQADEDTISKMKNSQKRCVSASINDRI